MKGVIATLCLLSIAALSPTVAKATSPGNKTALMYWYMNFESDYTLGFGDCLDVEKDLIYEYVASSGGYAESDILDRRPALLTDSPELTVSSLMSDLMNRGICVLHTHGNTKFISLVYYLSSVARDLAYTDLALTYNLTKEVDIKRYDHETDPSSTTVDYSKAIALSASGITKLLRVNDTNGLVCVPACSAINVVDNGFQHHSVVGYNCELTVSEGCEGLQQVFGVLACDINTRGPLLRDAVTLIQAAGGEVRPPTSEWQLTDSGCHSPRAVFEEVGAFDDVVWALVDQLDARTFRVLGCGSMDGVDASEVSLAEWSALDGNGRCCYVRRGLSLRAYEGLVLEEIDARGERTRSELIRVAGRPVGWDCVERFANRLLDIPLTPAATWRRGADPGKTESLRELDSEEDEIISEDLNCADRIIKRQIFDVALYSADAGLLAAEQGHLETRGWRVRSYLGDGSAADAAGWACAVLENNQWNFENNYVDSLVIPVLGIVGDPAFWDEEVVESLFSFALQDDGNGIDFDASGRFTDAAISDVPVYLIPASTSAQVDSLHLSIQLYEGSSAGQAILLGGDLIGDLEYEQPSRALGNLRNALIVGEREFTELKVSEIPGSRQTAFLEVMNNDGARLVAGVGQPNTHRRAWPGGFLVNSELGTTWSWGDSLWKEQAFVAFLPSCSVGNVTSPGLTPENSASLIEMGLFSGPNRSSIVEAIAPDGMTWDYENELWSELFGLTYGDCPADTPWPVIVWEAKQRAFSQYPNLLPYLRNTCVLGGMVKKREGVVVGVVEGCELGAGDVILRALIGPGGLPVLEISARYPRDMTVAIYDVTGRMVTSLYSGSVPAGVKCITWNGRDRMGRAVASGAYFARVFGSGATVGVARIVLIR